MNLLPRNVSNAVAVRIKPNGAYPGLIHNRIIVCIVLTVKLCLSAGKSDSDMAPRISIHWIGSYTTQNLGFPVVSAFPSTSGRSGHAKALLSGNGSAAGRREEDMRRRIFGFEAWARGRLGLSMVLKCGKRRVGDGFCISKGLSVVDTVSISA